jgi:hypothetical protein
MQSELQLAETVRQTIERMKTYPITINGKRWDKWEPGIINDLGQGKLP